MVQLSSCGINDSQSDNKVVVFRDGVAVFNCSSEYLNGVIKDNGLVDSLLWPIYANTSDPGLNTPQCVIDWAQWNSNKGIGGILLSYQITSIRKGNASSYFLYNQGARILITINDK